MIKHVTMHKRKARIYTKLEARLLNEEMRTRNANRLMFYSWRREVMLRRNRFHNGHQTVVKVMVDTNLATQITLSGVENPPLYITCS